VSGFLYVLWCLDRVGGSCLAARMAIEPAEMKGADQLRMIGPPG